MEIDLAGGAADDAADRRVARAQAGVQGGEFRLRLDHDAAPAPFVEPERDIVGARVAAADVDIGSCLLSGEGEGEMIVLEVLRVGKLHPDPFLRRRAPASLCTPATRRPAGAVAPGRLGKDCANNRTLL